MLELRIRRLVVAAWVLVALLTGPAPAPAATILLRAALEGSQQVPPNPSALFGAAFLEFDDVSGQLTVLMNVIPGGDVTVVRIHGPALPGVDGPVISSMPLFPNPVVLTLTPTQATEMLSGLWYLNVITMTFPDGEVRGQIGQALPYAAVLPASRSVPVGNPATAFVSVVNAGPQTATDCTIALASAIPATFVWQTTDPITNAPTGTPNTPVSIPPFRSQSFLVAITPTAPFAPTDVAFTVDCVNSPPAPSIDGINRLLLSASLAGTADVIAIAALPGEAGLILATGVPGAFAVAVSNVGVTEALTVSADTGRETLPLVFTLCQTNPATGACMMLPESNVTATIPAGAAASFAVFVTATEDIPLLPAVNRLFVRFKSAGGVDRGSTSVAVASICC